MSRYDDAGELNKRITFQRFIGDRDIVGDFQYLDDDCWDDIVTVWGSLRTISGREYYAAGQEQGEVTHNVKIRSRTWERDPSEMRILISGRRFRILSPPMDLGDGRKYQQLKVSEIWS